ncbi:MAG TPA: OmpA family protein [Candidatus Sulfomarinibacteraceae bacterium]|nr:OmpA family protein [Candidatus Sulfomarinibacteraceae bacterium]
MKLGKKVAMVVVSVGALGAAVAAAAEITLHAPQFPTGNSVSLDMIASAQAPQARVESKVTSVKEGQADIEVRFKNMKPAVLFGGDITAYVVWAVTKDGHATNLGELPTRNADGTARFRTGLKSFAILVTAEPYYLVRKPSEMVMFSNASPGSKRIPSDDFVFSNFVPAASHQLDSIVNVAWDSDEPLELIQAEKAYELAGRIGAESYAPDIFSQATITLEQARNLAGSGRKRKTSADFALRSVALSNDAIGISERKIEAAALETEIAARRAEMEALEERASQAETLLDESEVKLAEANEQTAALSAERAQLESAMVALRTEQTALVSAVAGLKEDRERLSNRLDQALSQVADTRNTARGTIVNLPDILFDLNQSTLKDEAKLVIAKLAGILLIMGDLNTRIEGHTDATGSLDYNMSLSEARAESVRDFLFQQGITADRMVTAGYGPARPIADNATADGRAKNRRVEIVIAEGEIAEGTGTD